MTLKQKSQTAILKSNSVSETFSLGKRMGTLVEPGDVLCVSGELGTGKTVLAKGVADGLGISEDVTSPTFTLVNEYLGRLPFYHIDVYRLGSPLEMADLGYEEYFFGAGVTLVEWAERVTEILPPERLEINIRNVPGQENAREINFFARGERYCRLLEELKKLDRPGD